MNKLHEFSPVYVHFMSVSAGGGQNKPYKNNHWELLLLGARKSGWHVIAWIFFLILNRKPCNTGISSRRDFSLVSFHFGQMQSSMSLNITQNSWPS